MIKNSIKNPLFSYLLIFLITVPVFIRIVRPGYYSMHDDFQVIRIFEMDKCFKDGQFPCRWVPDMGFGYGYPQFSYYAPLSYYAMELIHLIGFSFIDSVKLFIVLIILISTFGMYLFAKHLWKSEVGALISTFLYIYLPFRAVEIYVRGALPELTAMAVIPFLFLFVMHLVEGKRHSLFWFSISIAILFLSHNITTLIVTPIVVLWTAFLIVKNKSWGRIPRVIATFAIGFGLSAFFVVPAWFEKNYVHIDTLTSGYFNYLAHFVSLPQMLLSNHWGYGSSQLGTNDDISLGVGITHWIAAAIAVFAVFIHKKYKQLAGVLFFFFIGWFSLFLMHERSSFIWEKISILSFVQFPWRFLMLAGFCFCVAAGGVEIIQKKLLKWMIIGALVVATIFLYRGFFEPKDWLNITDLEKLTGEAWTKSITASLYDYLPISAQKGPDYEAASEPVVKIGRLEIISGDKGTAWQRWKVNVSSDYAVLELQMFYFPDFSVKVDGVEADINDENPYGLINVSLVRGEHLVEARLKDTPVRSVSNMVSVLSLVPLAYVFVRRK